MIFGKRDPLKMSLRDWMIHHQKNVVFSKCSWFGVPAWKNPLDAWVYQEILFELRPDVVVEIGNAHGGGTLFLAHMLELIGNGVVIGIDIDHGKCTVKHDRIEFWTGDSRDARMVERATRTCDGKKTLIIHDGDHAKEAVLADLRAYAPLVSVGSYFIVEDGVIDRFPAGSGIGTGEPGPLAAVDAFLAENGNFKVDTDRERYVITYNPNGFLKRVS